MELVVNAEYGAVLAAESRVYYVPTKTPSWQVQAPAPTEDLPELARETVLELPDRLESTVDVTSPELLKIDGLLTFTGDRATAVNTATDWAQIEELVGPLRYRPDVERAAMYMVPGACRPRVPVRVARQGLGSIGVYLFAHGHSGLSVSRALTLTYAELDKRIYHDVYTKTPSFEWEGFDYE